MRARGHLTPGCKKVEVCVGGSGVLTGEEGEVGVGGYKKPRRKIFSWVEYVLIMMVGGRWREKRPVQRDEDGMTVQQRSWDAGMGKQSRGGLRGGMKCFDSRNRIKGKRDKVK